jgi:hypothetical protein
MLFHVTSEDDILAIDEQGPGELEGGGSTFASEQELQKLTTEWPMKRLVEIWNRLPGVQPVTRFTDRSPQNMISRTCCTRCCGHGLYISVQSVYAKL